MLETYSGFNTLGIIGAMLLLGIFLRSKVKIFQQYLVPAAIIGGLAGFFLINFEIIPFTSDRFIPFTLHAFNISFMSLCLTRSRTTKKDPNATKEYLRGSMWLTMTWSTTFAIQALAGALALWLFNIVSGGSLSHAYGFLVTHGFTQGPGQGLAIGGMWEENFNVENARNIGLIYANIGFLVAFIIGVPIAKYLVSRNLNTNKKATISPEFLKGIYDRSKKQSMGNETTVSANVETLAVHIAVLGFAYMLTYFWLSWAVQHLAGLPGGTYFNFGFFFLHGLVICLLIRTAMEKLGCAHLLDHGVQCHITGLAVDIMLVASFMSVKMAILKAYIVPILIVCLAATLVTLMLIWFFGRRLQHLGPERMVTTIGCCCGATANGLLLLRILDPDYSTSVSLELAFFNVAIVAVTFPLLGFVSPLVPGMNVLELVTYYGVFGIITTACLYALGKMNFSPKEEVPAAATASQQI
ncbi:sodium/glutamate symporter [Desulfogranum mediterraneum]|uniref:sodium/glutamate symporter n=1 Tax=Desulfogranum mediterraneum TaxID=160661 RepID=UPI0004913653|nr:sodium/glutamate symporter [Desulfogranum mediterraneum]